MDNSDLEQWAQRLTERFQYGLDCVAQAARSFEARRESERAALVVATAAGDVERIDQLKWLLPDIEEEIERAQRGQLMYSEKLAHVSSVLADVTAAAVSRPLDPIAVDETKHELTRIRRVFTRLGLDFRISGGVSAKATEFTEAITGVRFDDHLKAMWRITDGSSEQYWFTDGDLEYGVNSVLNFLPLSIALLEEWWLGSDGSDEDDDEEDRVEEIQPEHTRHHLWFPFGDYSGCVRVSFDGDPTPAGKYGQIILYVHDPDCIYLQSTRFIDFFRTSNDVLEAALESDSVELREKLA